MAIRIEIEVNKRDSIKNCQISFERIAPKTLRTPISFALLFERAVVKFVKFIDAINKIKMAMIKNIFTIVLSPVLILS